MLLLLQQNQGMAWATIAAEAVDAAVLKSISAGPAFGAIARATSNMTGTAEATANMEARIVPRGD